MTHRVNRSIWIAALALTVALLAGGALASAQAYPNAHLIAEPEWLAANLDAENVRIIDLRSAADYQRAHIPGAVNIPGSGRLNNPDAEIGGWLLETEEFQALIRSLGVDQDTTVVAYDQSNGISAARLFYALELYGHFDKVRLLNGGFSAWTQARQPISREVPTVQPGNFVATLIEDRIATAEYIAEKLGSDDAVIIDTRRESEFTGEEVRAARGGTIPGSVHLEWTNNVTAEGTFKSADELFAMYSGLGADPNEEIIPFCQTNVRGAHTYFTLRLLGYQNVRPYEGSWSEWGNRTDLPIISGKI